MKPQWVKGKLKGVGKKKKGKTTPQSFLIGFSLTCFTSWCVRRLLFFFKLLGNSEEGREKPAKNLSNVHYSIPTYRQHQFDVWMYMDSKYIIQIMLCYVHIFTILPEG